MADIASAVCPCCGGPIPEIGETVGEMLDYIPARPRVLRIRRPKYGCRTCSTIHQAPAAPERPIAKGLASAGLLAHVLVSKYSEHLPLYRQSQIFARQGVALSRSTLANWVGGASWWLEALRERLAVHLFTSGKLFADDTVGAGTRSGSRANAHRTAMGICARRQASGRTGSTCRRLLLQSAPKGRTAGGASGQVPRGITEPAPAKAGVEGYAGFEAFTTVEVVLAACWAHTGRKFYEVHKAT